MFEASPGESTIVLKEKCSQCGGVTYPLNLPLRLGDLDCRAVLFSSVLLTRMLQNVLRVAYRALPWNRKRLKAKRPSLWTYDKKKALFVSERAK